MQCHLSRHGLRTVLCRLEGVLAMHFNCFFPSLSMHGSGINKFWKSHISSLTLWRAFEFARQFWFSNDLVPYDVEVHIVQNTIDWWVRGLGDRHLQQLSILLGILQHDSYSGIATKVKSFSKLKPAIFVEN